MCLANVCVPQDQVRAEAMKLAQEIAECSPLGLISTRATNVELVEQTKLRATEDFKEGVKATAERRVANFKGRRSLFPLPLPERAPRSLRTKFKHVGRWRPYSVIIGSRVSELSRFMLVCIRAARTLAWCVQDARKPEAL